jgi:hypothetical protein
MHLQPLAVTLGECRWRRVPRIDTYGGRGGSARRGQSQGPQGRIGAGRDRRRGVWTLVEGADGEVGMEEGEEKLEARHEGEPTREGERLG